ncbi:MAG TPA: GMC family oxidoreductase [Anaerolineaceae bacterium]|nr:GMC family oxidoreductase [Anaerolineaceae bacterium]
MMGIEQEHRLGFDIVIIGSGAGGGTLAYALRNSGARILLVERGDFLPQERENWSPQAVFFQKRYKNAELWKDASGNTFLPGVHYYVGGNTKVYGAALPRLRRQDFEAIQHAEGISPAWPFSYDDLEPYYAAAEQIYRVHGEAGDDPTEPARSGPYPFPPIPHDPYIAALGDTLRNNGLHPFSLPMGIDYAPRGRCIRCKTCDGFPCQVLAKSDADTCAVWPALQSSNVTLWTKAYARRLLTGPGGKTIAAVEVEREGQVQRVTAGTFVVSCGAVNSAALLLRSANSSHPGGLANSSGQVGRNYMVHNNAALMAVDPRRRNTSVFQKTIAVNDFYFNGPGWPYPMGNLQLLGKLQAGMLAAARPYLPRPVLQEMANRSVDWWVMSEDLPDPDNRVAVDPDGTIRIHWKPNNRKSHEKLIQAAVGMLREAGYPLVFVERMGIDTNSHQCGTIRAGSDPAKAVLDPFCRSYDLPNLFVMDSSFFPSSAAMNPALTIAAQALRVADHILQKPLFPSQEQATDLVQPPQI